MAPAAAMVRRIAVAIRRTGVVAAILAATAGCTSAAPVPDTSSTSAAPSGRSGAPAPAPPTDEDSGGPSAPTVHGGVVPAGSGAVAGPAACRAGDPLANVYHAYRLRLVAGCVTVSGVVESVRSETDGDVHFDVALDGPDTAMLTAANADHQHGWLVAEIVPADEPGCTAGQPPRPPSGTYDYGICSGAGETAPPVGAHVWITGPSVIDEDHGGWAEVHPVWAVSSTAPPG